MICLLLILCPPVLFYLFRKKTEWYCVELQLLLCVLTAIMLLGVLLSRIDYQSEIENFKYHKKHGNVKLFTQWLVKTQYCNSHILVDPFIPDEIDELSLEYDEE